MSATAPCTPLRESCTLNEYSAWIASNPDGARRALEYEEEHPQRHDLWLLRQTTFWRVAADPAVDLAELRERVLAGIHDPATRNGTVCVLASWRFSRFESYLGIRAHAFTVLEALREATMDGSCREDPLINYVLLPHARLSLEQLAGEPPTIPGLMNTYGLAAAALQEVLIPRHATRHGLYVNDDRGWLSFNASTETMAWRLPWGPKEFASLVTAALAGLASYGWFALHDERACAGRLPEELRDLVRTTRDLTQCAWLTVRSLRKKSSYHQDSGLTNLEPMLLGQLATLSWCDFDFDRAVQYARLATRVHWGGLGDWQRTQCQAIANRARYVPALHEGRSDTWGKLILSDPGASEALKQLDAAGYSMNAYGVVIIKHAATNPSPLIRLQAFRFYMRTGALSDAAAMAKYFMARELEPADVLEFAEKVSRAAQRGALGLNHQYYLRMRVALRKLFRCVALERFAGLDLLFLHHALLGLSYHAMLGSEAAALCAYHSVDPEVQESLLDHFAYKILPKADIFDLQHFRTVRRQMHQDTVYVGLASREGHSLSILVCTQNALLGFEQGSSGDDWHNILAKFHATASDQVEATNQLRTGLHLDFNPDVLRLVRRIVDTALDLSPGCARIVLHADPMWHVLPWQFLLSYVLREHVRVRSGQSNPDRGQIVVWMCQGFCGTYATANVRAVEGYHNVLHDNGDRDCDSIARVIDTVVAGGGSKPSFPRLSLVSHGRAQSRAVVLEAAGVEVSNEDLFANCGRPDFVVGHICHGALSLRDSRDSDLGGLPAFFLAHGSRVVLASPLPVGARQVEHVESAFAELGDSDWRTIETRYRQAIRNHHDCAMYTLFCNEVAPHLVRSTS